MKTILILNSIKPLSLRCHWSKLIGFGFVFITALSCNRRPDACVEVSPSTLELGQVTTISDCSDFSFNNEVKTGEGANFSDVSSMKWSYITPGEYNVTLKAFSKQGNKEDRAGHMVRVMAPDSNVLYSSWRATKVELREQLFVDPSISIFENQLIDSGELNEVYQIRGDSLFVSHYHETYNLFLNEYPMVYDPDDASLKVGDVSYNIVSFTPTAMILQGYYFKGYSLIYLSRV